MSSRDMFSKVAKTFFDDVVKNVEGNLNLFAFANKRKENICKQSEGKYADLNLN